MTGYRRVLAGLIAALTTASLACVAASPAHAGPRPGQVRQLVLLNGDRLTVAPAGSGRLAVAVRPAARRDALTSLRLGGQVLEVPAAALPYLGRGLSPSLFELGRLEKAESGGRLPLEVAFTGRRPALPGMTITRSAAGLVSGYLTPASARVFGAALWRQFTADHTRGSYGLLDGLHISLAGTPPAAVARPAFAMHTVTVRATGPDGRPDTGDMIFVTSVARDQDLNPDETTSTFYHGSAKFSLPAGRYWAEATFVTPAGPHPALRLVVLPQFTVAGQHTTVRLAARSATSKVTMATPRRSVVQMQTFSIDRGARGSIPNLVTTSWSGFTTWVSPTLRKPAFGTLRTFTSGWLNSPAGARPAYAYNLDFPGPAGLIPNQHFSATPSGLGAVTERYYQDPPTTRSGWFVDGGTPLQQQVEIVPYFPLRLPQVQTQYFSAGRDLLWNLETFDNLDLGTGINSDVSRAFSGGTRQSESWNAYPVHPAPDATSRGQGTLFPVPPSATRTGNLLRLMFTPFSDNQPGHLGAGFFDNGSARVTGRYTVAEDGQTIASGNPAAGNGIPPVRLSTRPAMIRFTLTASRPRRQFPLSPSSRTVWTWRSVPDPAARVPQAWYCGVTRDDRLNRRCAVQPLMTLSYQVHGLSLAGQTQPGPQVVTVTAGHIQLGGTAAIRAATAQVSVSAGRTWRPATVSPPRRGRFTVTFPAPAGALVCLRVTATDTAGGSISETILRGYRVTRAARTASAGRPGPAPAGPGSPPPPAGSSPGTGTR